MFFYQCKKCGKVIISKTELKALEGFEELKAGVTDAAQEKHVPVVTKKCKQVKVDVGSVTHPMSAEHYIEWIVMETEKGYQVKYLTPTDVPACSFSLGDDKFVAVYAYCNLHGLWKA